MSTIQIVTCGQLHGPIPAGHLIFDLRTHFKDPHVDPAMRSLTAEDTVVHDVVMATPSS